MDRKMFLAKTGLMGGMVFIGPTILLHSCKYQPEFRKKLSEADIPFLDEIGETILPETSESPGAKRANVGLFILTMVRDCFDPEEADILLDGINTLDNMCATEYGKSFIKLSSHQKTKLIKKLQQEALLFEEKQVVEEKKVPHYFTLIKKLTIQGYFTSKIGMMTARNYLPIPGKFEACTAFKPGDKPWAL
tara:strand:+ start:2241 stop:2813 length:573 start_codon:yes stop_codon:yes gene_type:complete